MLTVPAVEFLGEQDGPPERELKNALCAAFDQHPSVARAYLCRVRHECTGDPAVALAISAPENRQLVEQVGEMLGLIAGIRLANHARRKDHLVEYAYGLPPRTNAAPGAEKDT